MVISNKTTLSVSTITIKTNNNNNQEDDDTSIKAQEENADEDDNKSSKKQTKRLTSRQKLALVSLALVDFMRYCSISIMPPFYPNQAEKKGMSETISGLVFSFYAFIIVLSSPLYGKILPKVGEKVMFISGLVVAGICNISFGTLEYINDYTLFTSLSFLLVGLEALGASAYATAGYIFIINIFPNHIGMIRGILETFVGLGMSAGPAIGGFLFSVGGFGLPFYVVGSANLLIIPLNIYLLPSSETGVRSTESGSLSAILKIPGVIVTGVVIIYVSVIWSFLDPTLEPHLRQFKLSLENVGLLFLLLSAAYGISSPIWGRVSDKFNHHWSMMIIGLFFSCFALLLMGPSPILPFLSGSIWLVIIALCIVGIAEGLAILPTFDRVLFYAVKAGLENNLATQSIVSGMWSSTWALGEMIGPAVGGVLLQYYGFPVAGTIVAIAGMLLIILCMFYFITADSTTSKVENITHLDVGLNSEGSWRTHAIINIDSDVKLK